MSSRDSKSIASKLKYELIQSETEDKGNYMIKQSRDFTRGISADCQFLHSKILIYTVFAVVNTSSSRKKYETLSIAEIGMIQYSKIKHYYLPMQIWFLPLSKVYLSLNNLRCTVYLSITVLI